MEYVKQGSGRVSELERTLKECEAKLAASENEPLSDDEMMKVLEVYGEAQLEFESLGGYGLESRVKEILTGLGIHPAQHHQPVERFSGGWKMRIALARILALQPDVLLMDEPTNHLDLESIVWLEEWLKQFPGAIVVTSHDREFMNRVVKKIVEVGNGAITSYSGDYDFYIRERDIRRDQLQSAYKRQQDMLAKEEEFIARFAARASHAAQVQSRVKKLEKIERVELPLEERVMKFEFAPCPRSGNEVVKLEKLGKTYLQDQYDGSGDRPIQVERKVFSGASGVVRRLDRVAVVGVNGAGKSTLLKCISGEVDATEGAATLGASVRMGYFSQHALDVLNPKKTIFEEIHDRIPEATIGWVRNLLGSFMFSGDDAEKRIGVLSGGERSRVILATLLASPVNLLILDEPTNHLDIRSREILLDALKKYEGTILMVSHDRHFLKQLSSRVWEVDQGEIRSYDMTFEEYLARVGSVPGVGARKRSA
jgi:ATP-binding cassette subfamily F protein 3